MMSYKSPVAILLVDSCDLRTMHHFPRHWLPCATSPGLARGTFYTSWLLFVSLGYEKSPFQRLYNSLWLKK